MAGKYQLGQFYCEKGFIGKLSYIRGQSSAEIEKRVVYRAGRLSSGWVLLVMLKKPAPDQFSLGGYSQNSNAEVMERSPSGFPVRTRIDTVARAADSAADARLGTGYATKKRLALEAMEINGPDYIVKVMPDMPNIAAMPSLEQYPVGSGVPQWVLTAPMPFICAAVVRAGSRYLGGGAGFPAPEAWWSPANVPSC